VIVALGMTLIIEFGTQAFAGPTNVSYRLSQGRTFALGSFRLTAAEVAIIALSVVLMVAVHVLIRYTRLGKAMRATAANENLARNSGIRTERIVTVTWVISGALCGVAGAVFGMDAGTFGATSTDLFLVLILAAVFLGGPGEPYGAMLGALVIGLGTEISAAIFVSDYKDVVAFVVLLAMLAVRPTGLLGART
jgi:branched-chain amino acid transport system permease protein/neutral amino acid transport system permease protein